MTFYSFFPYLTAVLIALFSNHINANELIIEDKVRQRAIPVTIYWPVNKEKCTTNTLCPVVLLSAGYGVSHNKYQFLASSFTTENYLVIAIGHELPNDPPLSTSGNLYQTRSENWQRGVLTLTTVQNQLKNQFSQYDFNNLTLVGHSNGGDISAWLANENHPDIKTVITLDSRRVPLPTTANIQVMSIRASDFPADAGVLPTQEQQMKFNSCIVTIPNARHNDMSDEGPLWLRQKIQLLVQGFLKKNSCQSLKLAT
jgi:predicted esterase